MPHFFVGLIFFMELLLMLEGFIDWVDLKGLKVTNLDELENAFVAYKEEMEAETED